MTDQDWQNSLDIGSDDWEDVSGWKGWRKWICDGSPGVILFKNPKGEISGWKNKKAESVKVCLEEAGVPEDVIFWFHLRYNCK